MVTDAPGTTAPLGSVTVPSIELVNWAHAFGESRLTAINSPNASASLLPVGIAFAS